MTVRSYRELCRFDTFEERYRYLALNGVVGCATFGHNRWMNQAFYTGKQWRDLRHFIIARDEGMDLGVLGHPIHVKLIIHHINPITDEQLENQDPTILDPDNLITTTHRTHNAIHFGDERQLPRPLVERTPGDTTLWKGGTR